MDAATPLTPAGPLLFLVADPADAPAAEQLAAALAARGFRAWDAPLADPVTGLLDDGSMSAMEQADRVVVLASAAAAASDRVEKTVIVAGQLGKPLVAFRWIDTPAPPPASLAHATWLGPAQSPEAAAAQLGALLQPPLPQAVLATPGAGVRAPAPAPAPRRSRAWLIVLLCIGLVVAIAGGIIFGLNSGGSLTTNSTVSTTRPAVPDSLNESGTATNVPAMAPEPYPPIEAQPPLVVPADERHTPRTEPDPQPRADDPSPIDRPEPARPTDRPAERPPVRTPSPVSRDERAYSPSRDGPVPPANDPARRAGPAPARPGTTTPRPPRRDADPLPPGFGPTPRDRRQDGPARTGRNPSGM